MTNSQAMHDELHAKWIEALNYAEESVKKIRQARQVVDFMPLFRNQDRYWRLGWTFFDRLHLNVEMYPQPQPELSVAMPSEFAKFQGGYIAKTEQALRKVFDHVVVRRSPSNTTASDPDPRAPMDVIISAFHAQTIAGEEFRDTDKPSIIVKFLGVVPEEALDNPSCRVVYEPREVPARIEYVAKVVCDEPTEVT